MNTTNFNKQVVKDMAFVKEILPDSYKVGESKHLGSIHCVSKTGFVLPPYTTLEGRNVTHFQPLPEPPKTLKKPL